jgi:HEAT repeat protein
MLKCVIGLAAMAVLAAGCSDKTGNLSSSDPKERAQALQAVTAAADEKAMEKIAALARHENVQTASAAVEALGRISSPKACETLRQVMTTEQRPEVRRVAVNSLSQRKEEQAVETLRETLVRDPAPEVRGEAAVGLAKAGSIDDVPVLVAAAGRETDPKATRSQVLAMEYLIGVKFPQPDPKMTPEQRREQLQRIRTTALRLAEARKNKIPQGGCKHSSQQ